MKLHLKYLWIVLVACTLTACMNGGGDLAGKWQLRQYQYADGTSEKVDSVFYNFQKGSFSAICLSYLFILNDKDFQSSLVMLFPL